MDVQVEKLSFSFTEILVSSIGVGVLIIISSFIMAGFFSFATSLLITGLPKFNKRAYLTAVPIVSLALCILSLVTTIHMFITQEEVKINGTTEITKVENVSSSSLHSHQKYRILKTDEGQKFRIEDGGSTVHQGDKLKIKMKNSQTLNADKPINLDTNQIDYQIKK